MKYEKTREPRVTPAQTDVFGAIGGLREFWRHGDSRARKQLAECFYIRNWCKRAKNAEIILENDRIGDK